MRQTELEKPILFGSWQRKPSADPRLLVQYRDIWVDGVSGPVGREFHLASDAGIYKDWVALYPEYWKSGIKDKLTTYLKATRPELFRKPRIRKERRPPLRGENGKFISRETE